MVAFKSKSIWLQPKNTKHLEILMALVDKFILNFKL